MTRWGRQIWFWRIPSWAAICVVTALAQKDVPRAIAAGVLVGVGAIAIQLVGDDRPKHVATTAVVVATVTGLAACLLAPSGLGEVTVFVAVSRVPFAIDRGAGRVFVVLDTLAVAVTVGYISRSLAGVLAGIGVPLLAQRAVERRALIAARDEAQALLTEVQAGRDAEAQAAALRERGRIARDLHDVLAHSLAGLSLQLQATRAIAAREQVGPAVLEPLDTAAQLARDGLVEARAAVSALRAPIGLGLDEVSALVARHPGDAHLEVAGDPVPVAPEAGHAVYRAVQEALTNAARYAPGSPVSVTLVYDADGVSACVADQGLPVGRTAVASQGSGLGLAGMGERITAVGGTLTAGPQPGSGWSVRLRVPAA